MRDFPADNKPKSTNGNTIGSTWGEKAPDGEGGSYAIFTSSLGRERDTTAS